MFSERRMQVKEKCILKSAGTRKDILECTVKMLNRDSGFNLYSHLNWLTGKQNQLLIQTYSTFIQFSDVSRMEKRGCSWHKHIKKKLRRHKHIEKN